MKILLTGMTAQQANPASRDRVSNFAGYLHDALRDREYTVDWKDPSFEIDTSEYDRVIVGVAPITSLGANRTYGALNLIYQLWESPKLILMVDAPDPDKVKASLQAITDKPQNLLKEFFAYRKGYQEALEVPQVMQQAVKLLHSDDWPTTIVPALPWSKQSAIESDLPPGALGSVNLISVDRRVIDRFGGMHPASLDSNQWAYEPGSNRRWADTLNVTWPLEVVPKSSRREVDAAAVVLLRNSGGCLIAPDRHGTWWNTRYGMALANGVPVFTDWQASSQLGEVWSVLPSVFERKAADNARRFAAAQREVYEAALPDEQRERYLLEMALESIRSKV